VTDAEPSDTEPSDTEQLAKAIARAGGTDGNERQVRQILGLVTRSAKGAGAKAIGSGRWLAEVALEVAGHVPVRDLPTLQAHHDGLGGSLLAGALIRNASRSSAAVGAATGALAAASETTPASWGSLPLELAVETLMVVAIEMKLVAELHEAAGMTLPTSIRVKGPVIAAAWADSRGVAPAELATVMKATGVGATGQLAGAAAGLLGRSARDQVIQQLRRRLVRRTGRNLAAFLPMFIGAAAGAGLNHRATHTLGAAVATSLHIPPPP
jgi:hypothetical protein